LHEQQTSINKLQTNEIENLNKINSLTESIKNLTELHYKSHEELTKLIKNRSKKGPWELNL